MLTSSIAFVGIVVGSLTCSSRRMYDKRYHCPFCLSPQAKLSRHLLAMHTEEEQVRKYNGCTDQKLKAKLLTKFRNLGNHLHNLEVQKKGEGVLNVVYRPKSDGKPSNYVPCSLCFGYYAKDELWRHVKRCPLNTSPVKHKRHVADGRRLLYVQGASTKLRDVLAL